MGVAVYTGKAVVSVFCRPLTQTEYGRRRRAVCSAGKEYHVNDNHADDGRVVHDLVEDDGVVLLRMVRENAQEMQNRRNKTKYRMISNL